MRNSLIAIIALISLNSIAANTNTINVSKVDCNNVELNDINCNAIYNSTLAFMRLRNYPENVAIATAAAASNACFDEVEAASGTNPDCKPVTVGIKKS